MILKRLLGKIMIDMGFLTSQQIEEALQRQRKIFEEKTLPERLKRSRLVSEAQLAVNMIPLLGQILIDMGFATMEQLKEALRKQEKMVELYKSLESEKLGTAIEIGSIINSTLNLAEVLSLIMRHVNRVTNSIASTLMLLDDETGELVFSVPTGPKAERLTDIRIPSGKGIAGWVAKHEQPVLLANVREDPRFYQEIDRISGFETKSILCVPLKAKTRSIGVLEAINKADGTSFTEEDTLLLSIFAYQAAMAIENARLYSELKDQWEEEIQMEKMLAESEKFRALGQMAAGVAHDFNNLLMSIQGNASLMLLDIDSSHPHYDRLKNIEQSVQSGAELTKQFLGFSKGGEYEVKPTNINELIKRSSEMFDRTKKEINIYRKYQKDIWTVEVDQGQIGQILLNLYLNAWQAMPGGGKLYLGTENVTLDENYVRPFNVEPGNYVKISITDTGVGMDEATKQKIFEPFFTTKEMGRGTGLGLASVYGIIKNHRGIVNVYSEKGMGTTFDIYLPASEKEVVKEKELHEETLKGAETILLVDDEDIIVDVGEGILKALGYKVLLARSGKEAIEIVSKAHRAKSKKEKGKESYAPGAVPPAPDLVILDIVMPEMGGGEVYDRIKEIDPDIKVLLSSGYSIDDQAKEILERGCDSFIQKPFNMKRLSQRLREILDKR
jgi:signal transduction histidine kinase/ActR/RegA family two-component response regulator